MRLRNNPKAIDICNTSSYFKSIEIITKTPIANLFNNGNKMLYLEIGSGKGGFLWLNALENKNINYLGIEKFWTVIAKSINKYEKNLYKLDNILLTNADAINIDTYFPKQSIDKIFLNFSDPWPKKRHAKRRLIDIGFLKKYKNILKPNGIIEFKTDNDSLFDYCLEQINLKPDNIKIINLTYDLHSLSDNDTLKKNNIETEYEQKFISQNVKIKKVVFQFI